MLCDAHALLVAVKQHMQVTMYFLQHSWRITQLHQITCINCILLVGAKERTRLHNSTTCLRCTPWLGMHCRAAPRL